MQMCSSELISRCAAEEVSERPDPMACRMHRRCIDGSLEGKMSKRRVGLVLGLAAAGLLGGCYDAYAVDYGYGYPSVNASTYWGPGFSYYGGYYGPRYHPYRGYYRGYGYYGRPYGFYRPYYAP